VKSKRVAVLILYKIFVFDGHFFSIFFTISRSQSEHSSLKAIYFFTVDV